MRRGAQGCDKLIGSARCSAPRVRPERAVRACRSSPPRGPAPRTTTRAAPHASGRSYERGRARGAQPDRPIRASTAAMVSAREREVVRARPRPGLEEERILGIIEPRSPASSRSSRTSASPCARRRRQGQAVARRGALLPAFANDALAQLGDAGAVTVDGARLALTTESSVLADPLPWRVGWGAGGERHRERPRRLGRPPARAQPRAQLLDLQQNKLAEVDDRSRRGPPACGA